GVPELSLSCPCLDDRLADTAFEDLSHCPVVADHCVYVRLDPFPFFDCPPADLIARVDDDVLEQDSLCPSVSFAERVDHVQIAIEFGCRCNQLGAGQTFKPAGSG